METDQPKPTGDIAAIARETVLRWRGKLSDPETFEYLYENILSAINTALAAERVKLAGKEEFWHSCEVGYEQEIKELREQLAAERDKVQTLVDALKVASEDLVCPSANETHYCPNCDNSLYNAKAKIDAALAKVGTYPLPDGRTK